jgi:hypothetical protein
MTSIGGAGGPGGIGGAKPPSGVEDAIDVGDVGETGRVTDTPAASVGPARVDRGALDALANDIATGRLTAHEAVEQLVAQAGAGLPALEQTELRELLTELVANDPYLGSLAKQL